MPLICLKHSVAVMAFVVRRIEFLEERAGQMQSKIFWEELATGISPSILQGLWCQGSFQ